MELRNLLWSQARNSHAVLFKAGIGIGDFGEFADFFQIGLRSAIVHAKAGKSLAVRLHFFGAGKQNLLVFGGKLRPHNGIDAQHQRVNDIVPIAEKFVEVPYFQGNIDAIGGVFLTVHNALLKTCGGFCPVHVDGVCAKSTKCVNKNRAANHADLEALHVFGLGYGAFACGHFAEAVFTPSQKFNAFLFNRCNHHCA